MKNLFSNNKKWSDDIKKKDPDFFLKLSKLQNPEYLWIGCSDSRVPANEIVGLLPGELFVHRNIANMVIHTDFNCLSVLQYALDNLKVNHVIVCGHYGCGGIKAALLNIELGLVTNWIRHIQDIISRYKNKIDAFSDNDIKLKILCELNVIEQIYNISRNTFVQDAWKNRNFSLHGWIYGLKDGLLKDLDFSITKDDVNISEKYSDCVSKVFKRYEVID